MVVKINPEKKRLNGFRSTDESQMKAKTLFINTVNEPFSWPFAQHSAKVLPDLDRNPETTDLILFDNHVDIGVFPRNFIQI